MAATPESFSKAAVQRLLHILLEQLPATREGHLRLWHWWIQPGFGQSAAPDLIGMLAGRFFAVEIKADPSEGGKPIQGAQLDMQQWMATACDHGGALTPAHYVKGVTNAQEFESLRCWLLQRASELCDTRTFNQIATDMHAVPWRSEARLRAIAKAKTAPKALRIKTKREGADLSPPSVLQPKE